MNFNEDLRYYDYILVETSAGKDSLVMLDVVCEQAKAAGVLDRVIAVHANLGRVEWEGTAKLAREQAERYGVQFWQVRRSKDLLYQVEFERKKWPGPGLARFCTSDHKTKEAEKLMTQIVRDFLAENELPSKRHRPTRRVRILNCLGLRAQESRKRRAKPVWSVDPATNATKREVTRWLPIHKWTEDEVWRRIRERGLKYHWAYDLGMPRLSCVFCIYAPKKALLLAGYHNRKLLSEYVGVERRIGHAFKYDKDTGPEPLVQIENELNAGYVPAGRINATEWAQCA